jgi:mannose-6-phosphate isomerase-like protein (cupin superfamily)
MISTDVLSTSPDTFARENRRQAPALPGPPSAFVKAGQSPILRAYGDEVAVHLGAERTGGRFTFFTGQTPAGGGPPPHFHAREEEWFFVLEGRAEFLSEDAWTEVPAGTSVFMPRHSLHAFRNTGSGPLRQAIHTSPGGFDLFFRESALEFQNPEGPQPARLLEIGARFGIYFPTLEPGCASRRERMTLSPAIVRPGEGRRRHLFGEDITIQLDGTQTGGLFTAFLEVTAPGGGPPPHVLADCDEWFFVLDGAVEFLHGDAWENGSPGSTFFAPRGTVHTFRNTGSAPARVLVHAAPAGIEVFFDRAHELFAGPGGPNLSQTVGLAGEHGIRFVE